MIILINIDTLKKNKNAKSMRHINTLVYYNQNKIKKKILDPDILIKLKIKVQSSLFHNSEYIIVIKYIEIEYSNFKLW